MSDDPTLPSQTLPDPSLQPARRTLSTIPSFLVSPDPAGIDRIWPFGGLESNRARASAQPVQAQPRPVPALADVLAPDEIERFEPLATEGEFGAPLQQLGSAAGSLFQAARLGPHQVLTLLHSDLTPIFERGRLSTSAKGWLRDRHHGVEWASGLTLAARPGTGAFEPDPAKLADAFRQEAERMRGLRRRFLARLAGGGVVFVLASPEPVEPALLAMIEAELARLGQGAPFWLLALSEARGEPASIQPAALSPRVLTAVIGRTWRDGDLFASLLRQALAAAPFPSWPGVRQAVVTQLAPQSRTLPLPAKAEVGGSDGALDFGWGRASLVNGHDWSRQVGDQFLFHASEPTRPGTALEWHDVRLAGPMRLSVEAAVPIPSIAPLQLVLTVGHGESELGRTRCEMNDEARAGTLNLAFTAKAHETLTIRLSATTLRGLEEGERSVIGLRALALEPERPEGEPPAETFETTDAPATSSAASSDPGEPLQTVQAEFVAISAPMPGDETLFQRHVLAPRETWAKAMPRFVANLSGGEPDISRIYKVERLTQGRAVDRFEDACVVGFNGIVKSGRFFDRYTVHDEENLLRLARAHGAYENCATGLQLHEGAVVLAREALEGAERLDHSVFLGTPDEPDNWGMWLLLGVAGMHEFLANRDRYDRFLCEREQPWQRSLLQTYGVAEEDIVEQRRGAAYRCRSVSLLRMVGRDLILAPHECELFRDLAGRLVRGSDTASPSPERIFISRLSRTRKGGAYRGLINEEELIDALVPLGFTVVEPEYLSFAEQVALFAQARVVVGLGGAAMFNTVFCRPQTQVVTIESTGVFLDAHTNLFSSLGLDYGVIIGEEDLTDPRRSQRRWRLDVPGAVAALRPMLG